MFFKISLEFRIELSFCFFWTNFNSFNSIITNFRIGFRDKGVTNVILSVGEKGGTGTLDNLSVNESLTQDDTYKTYLDGKARRK